MCLTGCFLYTNTDIYICVLLYLGLLCNSYIRRTGGHAEHGLQSCHLLFAKTHVALKASSLESSRRRFLLLNKPFFSKVNRKFSVNFSDQLRSDYVNVEPTSTESQNDKVIQWKPDDGADALSSFDANNFKTVQSRTKMFKNRFLDFVRLSSVLNNAAESFFKSEIRRRLFVTAILIVISRVGYFIPLPGFDRRLIPQDYLSFASGSVGKLQKFIHSYICLCCPYSM
jgi:hypothetical protein